MKDLRDTDVETEQAYATWMQQTGGYAKDMTLRDHYAGLAMQAYLMDEAILQNSDHSAAWLKSTAAAAYEQADAMLKENAK